MKTIIETNYNFPVELIPVKANDILIPKKLAVIRTDTKESIGIVTNRYGLLKHENVINSFREALDNQKYEEKIEVIKNGAHLFATYRLLNVQYEVIKGDFISLQYIVKNSYDGSKSFSLMLGALRLVCLNGMVVNNELFNFSFKHTSLNKTISDSNILRNKIIDLSKHFENSVLTMKQMTTTEIKQTDKIIFDEKRLEIPKYLIKFAFEKYSDEKEKNVWNYYNSLTFAISHKMKNEKPQSRIDYTKRAWTAASELLEV